MTDKELLEAAAKAVNGGAWHPLTHDTPNGAWNPLTDDGDALRLAVKLRLTVRYHETLGQALVDRNQNDRPIEVNVEDCGRDECAATRRAIVRAAAALGEKR